MMAFPRSGMTPLPFTLHLIFILRQGALVRDAFHGERFGAVRMAQHLLVERYARQHMLGKTATAPMLSLNRSPCCCAG